MPEEPKQISCPNCLGPAIKEGNVITCEACDAIFVITKKEGAKLKQLGPIEDHEKRISRLESIIPGQEPKPVETDDNEDKKPEESSILGD